MRKYVTLVLCCLILVSGMLVSCGTQSNAPATGGEATVVPAVPAQKSVLDEIKERGKLRMAIYYKSGSPLQRINDAGQGEGYFVDLGNLMAKDLGVEAEFVDVSEWASIIPTLLSGKVDIIISGVSATPERGLSIDFPGTIVYYDMSVLVRKDGKVKTVADLEQPGVIISVNQGSSQHFYVTGRYPNAVVKPVPGIQEARLEVASGKADACVLDSYQGALFIAEYPDTTLLRSEDGEIEILGRETGSPAIRQGDERWYRWLENWLRWYGNMGTFDSYYDKWIDPVMAVVE